MIRNILFFGLSSLFFSSTCLTQIESGKKDFAKPKKEKKKIELKSDSSGLSIYAEYIYASSFRFLKPNGNFFGEELGERANEKSIKTNNFSLGLEQHLSKKLYLSFGMSYINYGEKYSESFSDSLLTYQNTYSYIAVPVQLGYEKAIKRLTFSASTGLQAQFLNSFKNELGYFQDGKKIETTSKDEKPLNLTSLSSITNLRVAYSLSSVVDIYFGGVYLLQLTSSLNKQQTYIHKPYLIAGKIGLLFNF